MERIPRGRYTKEFREEAVKLVTVEKLSVPEAGRRYIPTDEGWLYLVGHKDLFNAEIVGYAMGERLTKNLVSESMFRALESRHPCKGLLHHSDRGSQYCSYEYRGILDNNDLVASMSGKGNCYDNAPMESFWGTLKQELVYHRHYQARGHERHY